jgi:tetrahydromethanopterin S-methyltransferase subunit B
MATKPEIERLAVVETKVDSLASDVRDVKDDVKAIKTALETLSSVNDRRYAAKWVQTAVSFVVGLIVAAVLTALVALVIKSPQSSNSVETTNKTTTTENK